MSNEIDKAQKSAPAMDGFEGYESGVEGKEMQTQSDRGFSGVKLKFLDGVWLDPNEEEVKAELVVLDVQRKVQKWLTDDGPAETIVLAPGARWPDIDAMNASCPENEWREKFGKRTGPWAGEHVVLFVDPATMERYWWPSPLTTIGSAVCVRNLVSQVKLMRQFKGALVYAIVKLSHTFMNTAYGGRERPHLDILRWITFGGGGGSTLPASNQPVLTGSAAATVESKPAATGESKPVTKANLLEMQTVEKPTAKEVTDDSIPF